MFGDGKLREKKAKKRHTPAYYVVGTFTFSIEFMLGVNAAFLVDQSISIVARNMLAGTFLEPLASVITLLVSLAVGFCFVFGGMWVFSGFMDSLDDARAYMAEYGTNRWPVVMIWILMLAVVALDFTTLLFRAAFFAERGAGALFVFFLILILMPPVLGAIIHVLEHTPRDRRLAKARQYGESLESDDAEQLVRVMDPDLRSRWLNGDASAVQAHYDRVAALRAENQAYEQQQIAARDAKKQEEEDRKQIGQENRKRPLPFGPRRKQA